MDNYINHVRAATTYAYYRNIAWQETYTALPSVEQRSVHLI